MTTPSKYKRLNEAANLYIEYCVTAQKLCQAIEKLEARTTPPEGVDPELAKLIERVAKVTQEAIQKQLAPFIQRLREIDIEIAKNIPNPNKRIITPDEVN